MTKSKKAVLTVLVLLIFAGLAVLLLYNSQTSFTGSRVKNPDAYLLDIEKMNGTDMHTLELREGDVLQIRFETEKGSLYTEIKAPDGTAVYRGNGKEATDFTLNISQSGVYTVVAEARHAKGTVHIQLKDAPIRETVAQIMEQIRHEEIECAILQSRSPTCGVNQIYDGSFSGKLISGSGVFAKCLIDAGYRVIDAEDISKMSE